MVLDGMQNKSTITMMTQTQIVKDELASANIWSQVSLCGYPLCVVPRLAKLKC